MNSKLNVDLGPMEGRTFTIGREGHVYIGDPTVSNQHAEIKIIDGRIYLRDLNSTNGTYLFKNNRLVYFDEGYVSPLQSIVIGDQKHTIQSLLAIASDFVALDDSLTQVNFTNRKVNSRG